MTSRTKIGKSTILFAFIFIGLSSGAPPLDVSEFFGIPAAAAPESTPEVSMPPQSKARAGGQSDLLAQLLSSLGKFLILKSHVKSLIAVNSHNSKKTIFLKEILVQF